MKKIKKKGETQTNEINNQPAPSHSQYNEQNNYGYPQQYQGYDPWGIGYGGFGYGYGWPPYQHQPSAGFGYGYDQQPHQQNEPPQQQNEPPQQGPEEGGFYDMPYYDPYFGYNYQFGGNQQSNDKKP